MPASGRPTDHSILPPQYASVAAYNAASPKVLTALAVQKDQVQGTVLTVPVTIPWQAPNLKSVPAKPARVVQYMDGSWRGDGYYTFTWQFSFWTSLMMWYFLNTLMGVDTTGTTLTGWSVPATAKTYPDANWLSQGSGWQSSTAIYLAGQMQVPQPGTDYTIVEAGFKDVKIHFWEGTVIT